MPSLEVGTVGGGTILGPQSACLKVCLPLCCFIAIFIVDADRVREKRETRGAQ